MAEQLNLIFIPASYSELFTMWNRYPTAVPYAGGTELIRKQGSEILALPSIILSLEKIEEMHRISRTERYMEVGAMVKLSQIIDLGKIVPVTLRHCLRSIGGPQLRNMATIGGNFCARDDCLDSSAVLVALDAQCEIRNAQSTRWISASRFHSQHHRTGLKPKEILTRIKVPLDTWDYSIYKKFSEYAGQSSRVVVFLVKAQKNILSDIRIIYKNKTLWRDKRSESILIGKQLPLNYRIVADFVESWKAYISGIGEVDKPSRKELVNFIEVNILNFSE